MTASEIRAAIRRDIREPSAITVGNDQIDAVVALGGDRLWEALLIGDPTRGKERVSLASTYSTNEFSLPSDCYKIFKVWDMMDNAEDITAASNASPIELTVTATSFEDDQIIRVHDVAGNTAANGVWKVDNQATNTIELTDSTGNASYTSGGKAFQEKSTFREMVEIDVEEATYVNKWQYFLRSGSIIVDYPTFDNDLVLDYTRNYNAITDIPAKYHIGLVSYAVGALMRLPTQDAKNFGDIQSMLQYHSTRYNSVITSITGTGAQSARPKRLPDAMHWDYL
jgi:hypothetical protein